MKESKKSTIFSEIKKNLVSYPWSFLRRSFLSGMAIIVPLILTFIVLSALLSFFDAWIQPIFITILGYKIPGLGLIFTTVIIIFTGALTRNIIGRKLLGYWDKVLLNIPIVKNVYGAIRQVFSTFSRQGQSSFKHVVLFEYPSEGLWSIGFENARMNDPNTQKTWAHIFVMTAINPAGGFLVLVPEEKVRRVDVSVESAIKLIVSGGIIIPDKWENALAQIGQLDKINQ